MASLRLISFLVAMIAAGGSNAAQADDGGDAAAGQKVFNACKACHTIDAGGPNRVGPNLHGVFGRKAGTADGFKYSPALKDSDVVWDEAHLDAYLKDPKGTIPGNRMAFAGVKKDDQRKDLIAYLRSQSQ